VETDNFFRSRIDWKRTRNLFIEPSSNVAIQAFRGFFVGGIAFMADASVLWLLTTSGIYYLISAVFGFIVGVMVNYSLSIRFVFKEKATIGKFGEITVYFILGVMGLGLTIVLIWFFTEVVGLFYMLSKCITALLTFAWNFTSRKILLYRKAEDL